MGPPRLLTGLVLIALSIGRTIASDERFSVVWNVPTDVCHTKNVSIPLEQFGIRHNTDVSFYGDEVVLFYERNIGLFPFYENYTAERAVNGGLPQNVNLAAHLRKTKDDIRRLIPRADYAGIAVIDFEEWRPLYELNWGRKQVYQRESRRLVEQRYPNISKKSVELRAETEFNKASRNFFLLTMSLAREMRPFARWGFYGFPYCTYTSSGAFEGFTCGKEYRKRNNKLRFVTSSGTALFPSIYLGHAKKSIDSGRYIQAIMAESNRISESAGGLPIYPYSKFEYDPYEEPGSFYKKRDLCNSIKQTTDRGAAGIVLWSTTKGMQKRCQGIADYISQQLGPAVLNVQKNAQCCRKSRCSGHGQCIITDPTQGRCQFRSYFDDYSCKCDPQYTGLNCERRHQFSWLYKKIRTEERSISWQPLQPMSQAMSAPPTTEPLTLDTPQSISRVRN